MQRLARLDALNALHQVMVRGVERRVIFRDDSDGADFGARVARLRECVGLNAVVMR